MTPKPSSCAIGLDSPQSPSPNPKATKEEIGNQPKSDIVFLRAWSQVEFPQFYNPLTTAMQPRDKTWLGMRTVAELRKEHNLPIPVNKDSLYKKLERKKKEV